MFKPALMKRLSLWVLSEDVADATVALAACGLFNPELVLDPDRALPENPAERFREIFQRAHARLRKIRAVGACPLGDLDTPPRSVALAELEKVDRQLGVLWHDLSCLEEELRNLNEKRHAIAELAESLARFQRLDMDLSLFQTERRFLSLRVGTVPKENLERLRRAAGLVHHLVRPFPGSHDGIQVLIAGPAESAAEADELLRTSGFVAVKVPSEFQDRPEKVRAGLGEQSREIERLIEEKQAQIRQLAHRHQDEIEGACRTLALAQPYAQLSAQLRARGAIAAVEGWIPSASVARLRRLLHENLGQLFVLNTRDPLPDEIPRVPTVITHPRILQPFVGLVKNYGIPRYGEVDPTLLFSITFVLMFGMMFGDIGHGAVLATAGLLALRRNSRVATYLLIAGASSAVFGALYGSIFGFEDWFHPLWMAPLSDPLLMLSLALYWGIGFILIATLLTIYNLLNEGRREAALYDTQGVAGLLFYAAGIYAAFRLLRDGSVGLPETAAILIPFAVVLAYKWRSNDSPLGEKILVVAVEGFESIVSYISNTLSFLRVAAFSLNHVALAIAVFTLADMLDTPGHWITVVLGNLFIIVVEGFIVTIQVLRLEYYEGFSRFFRGDGREFHPLRYQR